MYKIGKQKRIALSLVEIIVSLALFSFIMSIVIAVSISLARAQQRVQAEIFLTQTAQTTLEAMSRNLRYGYAFSGINLGDYANNGNKIFISERVLQQNPRSCSGVDEFGNPIVCTNPNQILVDYATSTQIVSNIKKSPVIIFEKQSGNPTTFSDQNAYCASAGQLYKIESFQIISSGSGFERLCTEGLPLLPEGITLNFIYFDVLGQSSENPKNPIVRIRFNISSELGGSIDIQTTITQRLIQLL